MTSPRDELREEIEKMISIMFHSDDQGCEVCTRGVDAILTAADTYHKSEMARVIGEDDTSITEAKIVEHWAMNRNRLRAEQRERAGLSQPATRHGEEGEA